MPSRAKIKQYQQLKSKKFRQKYGLFVVEGLKSINELADSAWHTEIVVCTAHFYKEQADSFRHTLEVISDEDFRLISNHKNPQGVLAIARYNEVVSTPTPWQIALDGINDPGNLGTIIRIADWYGINTIYASQDCVDVYNSKTIQSTMGSFLRVKVIEGDLAALLAEKHVYATLLNGQNIRAMDAPKTGVLLIGNEANGIRPELLAKLSHTSITIPGGGHTESLNAAMAAAICCERLVAG